jgi:hypothetical protein
MPSKKVKKSSAKQKVLKKTDGDVIREMSLKDFEEHLLSSFVLEEAPDKVLALAQKQYAKAIETKGGERDKIMNYLNSKSLESKYHLLETIEKNFLPFALRFTDDLVKEYDAKTPSEISLVQMAVLAYCRYLKSSQRFKTFITQEYIDSCKAQYCSIAERAIDKAYREYTSILQTLRHMKQPPMTVSIKTNTAFVAQNQQNNANPPLLKNNAPQ